MSYLKGYSAPSGTTNLDNNMHDVRQVILYPDLDDKANDVQEMFAAIIICLVVIICLLVYIIIKLQ